MPVEQPRHELHKWLVEQLTSEPTRILAFKNTLCIDAHDLIDDYQAVSRQLTDSDVSDADENSTLVIDLSSNPYDLLRDPIAYDVARFAVTWTAGATERTSVVLLPALPPRGSSLFWKGLTSEDAGGRITVLGNNGGCWPETCPEVFTTTYAERLSELQPPIGSAMRRGILREPGHFAVGDGANEYCARYFFDATLASSDISRLIYKGITSLGLESDQPIAILTHGESSPWVHVAGLLAGSRLPSNPPVYDITNPDDTDRILNGGQLFVLVLDVINTGATCEEIVRGLISREAKVASTIFAAMMDHQCGHLDLPSGYEVESLIDIETEKSRRADCVQCELSLPFTKPLADDYECRPFDMWQALLTHQWKSEAYGPDNQPRFPDAPDMGSVFESHGDWIAFKVSVLLREWTSEHDVVFVCPEELEINKLLRHLSPRFDGRTVAVRVPRSALNSISHSEHIPDSHDGWRQQLHHVANARRRSVVMIDEFNGSNTTAYALMKLLKSCGVKPDLYIPILNRVPSAADGLDIPVRSLYEIPSPRRP